MVPEAPLESTENGLVAAGDGWFVLGALEARWRSWEGLGVRLSVTRSTRPLAHRAGVTEETSDAGAAYAHYPERRWARYRPGWLGE